MTTQVRDFQQIYFPESILQDEEWEGVQAIVKLPLHQLDAKKRCAKLGQEMFETYKKIEKGDSKKGGRKLMNVFQTLKWIGQDAHLRAVFVKNAWGQVGDVNWCFCLEQIDCVFL